MIVAAAGCALFAPALATAGSGGGAMTPASTTTTVAAQPADLPVTASGDGLTITAQASDFFRTGLSVTGSAPAGDAGKLIEIDQLVAGASSPWVEATVAQVQPGGSFAATWRPSRIGQYTVRAVLQSAQGSSAAAPPAVTVTLYRRSLATLYGPGLYGDRTACGEILRRRTLGVANRTLKCGTEISIYYDGRSLTVPVIDRGPYAHGANWDLTMATSRALGMLGTSTIGAATVPAPAAITPSGP
jgi:rare lipoprotein A